MITFEVTQDRVPEKDQLGHARLLLVAHACDRYLPAPVTGIVTLTFIDDTEMRRLNRMYRGKDKTTDVLSFPSSDADVSGYLGDVLISYDQALRQAEEGDLELELTDLLIHGILHVLGYDHERPEDAEKMFPLQDEIVASLL